MLEKPLTTSEVARVCGVVPRVASQWIDAKMIPAWKVGRDRRVDPRAMVEFLKAHGMLEYMRRTWTARERKLMGLAIAHKYHGPADGIA